MSPILTAWCALAGAIAIEVIGTTFLQKSDHFTRLVPTLACAALYAASFYLLAQALRVIPLGVAYSIWGGLGIVVTAIIGVLLFKQRLDWIAIVGIGFIVVGVVIINGFSKTGGH